MAPLASIPILTAATAKSSRTAAICAATISGGSGWTAAHAQRVLRRDRGDGAGSVDAERGEGLEVGLDARAAAGIGAGDRQRDRDHARVASTQARVRASGSAFSVMSVTTETMSAPAARQARPRSMLRPPMATSGIAPIRRFHSPIRSSPCGAEAHGLQDRRIDRPERDIVGRRAPAPARVRPRRGWRRRRRTPRARIAGRSAPSRSSWPRWM